MVQLRCWCEAVTDTRLNNELLIYFSFLFQKLILSFFLSFFLVVVKVCDSQLHQYIGQCVEFIGTYGK